MAKVKILDDILVNQIAAGEVVERPASVAKELIENAIDAGASEIGVAISNGGKTALEVRDNGSGMEAADVAVAVKRFGTSKISSSQDLEAIQTLGFRGEALPSIASVSKFTLSTSTAEDDTGTMVRIEGGHELGMESVSTPRGTSVQVKSLFFNVPARKKFLRKDATEAAQIKTLLSDFALAYPHIRFSLTVDNAQSLSFPPVADLRARALQTRLIDKDSIAINERFVLDESEVLIQGALSSPIHSVASATKLRLLVNGRSVRDKVLIKAIRDGYGNFLRPGRHPAGVLSLQLPAQEVDVNVHPQKTEVRFRNPSELFRAVLLSVSRALSKRPAEELQESASPDAPGQAEDSAHALDSSALQSAISQSMFRDTSFRDSSFRNSPGAQREFVQPVFSAPGSAAVSSSEAVSHQGTAVDEYTSVSRQGLPEVQSLMEMRYVGQIFSLYLLFEGVLDDGRSFAVLDMHAAHERVVFFQLKEQLHRQAVQSQQLLLPLSIPVDAQELERFEAGRKVFETIGFRILAGEDSIEIQAVPALLANAPIAEIVRDILAETELAAWENQLEATVDQVIARLACHGSVRSGRVLKEQECRELVASLSRADSSGLCPHGRPVVRYFSEYELEQIFGRA